MSRHTSQVLHLVVCYLHRQKMDFNIFYVSHILYRWTSTGMPSELEIYTFPRLKSAKREVNANHLDYKSGASFSGCVKGAQRSGTGIFLGRMVTGTTENMQTMRGMGKESSFGPMGHGLGDRSLKTWDTAMVKSPGRTERWAYKRKCFIKLVLYLKLTVSGCSYQVARRPIIFTNRLAFNWALLPPPTEQ